MPYRPDAPYKQSRSVLRQIYGSRAIDGSAPQSSRDFTPSGRLRYREQQGMREDEAELEVEKDFQRMGKFQPRPVGFAPYMDPSPWRGVSAVGPATAIPEAAMRPMQYAMPAESGMLPSMGLPTAPPTATPLAFNLSEPSTLPASTVAQFAPPGMPAVTGPQAYTPPWRRKQNTGYMGSILAPASRWLA